ncbi:MAG: TonB-dependent siderophore receptor [Leptolyngbya sp. SIOISBB]|nr:TonB-dependent siderophore receptor [Leptolyngbya sp. SIOISBB]
MMALAVEVEADASLSTKPVSNPATTAHTARVMPTVHPFDEPAAATTQIDEPSGLGAQTQLVEITNVQIEATADGFTLQLDASGELALPEIAVTGNAAIADIPNAVLNLPDTEEFFVSNPTEGIALIDVVNLPDNLVRIAITGTAAPPTVEISVGTTGLMVRGIPGVATVAVPDDEVIQVVVTGEQVDDDYFVPSASSATRTDTPVLDIPQAIQVVPQQVLEDQQILRVDDALRNVSGVVGQLDALSNNAALALRGFTTNTFSNGPILRDGFRITNNFTTQEIANVERIEVIKGPASVLYGQSDPGGIINLVTKRPLPYPFYDLEVQVGSVGLIRPSVDLTGPLAEDGRLAYRLNAVAQHEESFRDFDTDTSRAFIAPVLSWQISDRTNLTLLMEYLDEETPFDPGLPVLGNRVVDVPRDRIQVEPNDQIRSDALTLGYDLSHQVNDDWVLNHGFRYVAQDYGIRVALPLAFDETTRNVTRFFADRDYRSDDYVIQANVIGEFDTGSIQHTLLAGVDVNFNRFDDVFTRVDFANPTRLDIFNPIYGTPRTDVSSVAPLSTGKTEADRYGVFLQDQITFSEQFILVGSLRYDSVDFRDLETPNNDRYDDAWSPRIGIVYQPIETLSFYANYAQSFEPNFGRTANGAPLEPERSEGYEIGIKAELLAGDLLATLAYFDITKQNVSTADPNNLLLTVATGEQRSQGIELDIVGEILPGWNIIANYAYIDARITADNTNSVGNRLPNAPYHSGGLWTTYEIQQGDLQGLGFGFGVNYVGQREGDLANTFEVEDYFLTNAALFYEREDWRLGLNFNNLFDVNYFRVTDNRTFGNIPGAPFSVVGSVSVKF